MLSVNQPDIQLGQLNFGETHTFHYDLVNTSGEPISIIKVNEGCKSCTKTSVDNTIILPHQAAKLEVQYTPGSTGISLRGIDVLYKVGEDVKPTLKLTFKSVV